MKIPLLFPVTGGIRRTGAAFPLCRYKRPAAQSRKKERKMTKKTDTQTILSRRMMLRRIGLAAGTAYLAPAMVGLNAAHASSGSGGGSGSGSGGNSGASAASNGGNSGPSRSDRTGKKNRNSVPSRTERRGNRSNSNRSNSNRRSENSLEGWMQQALRRF